MSALITDPLCAWWIYRLARKHGGSPRQMWWALLGFIGVGIAYLMILRGERARAKVQP